MLFVLKIQVWTTSKAVVQNQVKGLKIKGVLDDVDAAKMVEDLETKMAKELLQKQDMAEQKKRQREASKDEDEDEDEEFGSYLPEGKKRVAIEDEGQKEEKEEDEEAGDEKSTGKGSKSAAAKRANAAAESEVSTM